MDARDLTAIWRLMFQYAVCVWNKDADGIAELFAEEGVVDLGTGGAVSGRERIREVYRRAFAEQDLFPFIQDPQVQVEGDRARGTCRLQLRAIAGGRWFEGGGEYEDEFVRTAQGWKFLRRQLRLTEFKETDRAD
ncbi:MAG TPA: nuclear transport factor 2 family protein [Dehalococcoidia bacterium]|nr:nuclear transport factor 2 family protein [Dehalococcoidia bacterium]